MHKRTATCEGPVNRISRGVAALVMSSRFAGPSEAVHPRRLCMRSHGHEAVNKGRTSCHVPWEPSLDVFRVTLTGYRARAPQPGAETTSQEVSDMRVTALQRGRIRSLPRAAALATAAVL